MIVFWAWVTICFLDAIGGALAGFELWKRGERGTTRLAHVLFSTAFRSMVTFIGLHLFGLNLQAKHWYLWLGFAAVTYKAYSTWSWFLWTRGIINGGGWFGIFSRRKRGGERPLGS